MVETSLGHSRSQKFSSLETSETRPFETKLLDGKIHKAEDKAIGKSRRLDARA